MTMRFFALLIIVTSFVSLAPLVSMAQIPGGNISPGIQGGNPPAPQGSSSGKNVTLINPLNSGDCTPNGNCLMDFLSQILGFVVRIGAIAVVLMLVFVGYKFVIAQGNPEAIAAAKNDLIWTLIGALILLGAQAISYGIKATVATLSVG